MRFTIINNNTGESFDMKFESDEKKKQWLDMAKGFQYLGEAPSYQLPTRHVRMRNKEEKYG